MSKPIRNHANPVAHGNLRAQVIRILVMVNQGKSLSSSPFSKALNNTNDRDRGLFNQLVMGSCRHWCALDRVLQPMLQQPLSDLRVHAALIVGMYQIFYTRIPAHAAISETVEAIKQLGQLKASGLVNALLRRCLREQAALEGLLESTSTLPSWLDATLAQDWPEHASAIERELRCEAPLFIRVNAQQQTRDEYLKTLQLNQIEAVATARPHGIRLLAATHIPSLIGFDYGWFSVQDDHAQLCAQLFDDLTNKRVLDACAAPGGKTAHLLESFDLEHITALDSDAERLKRVSENLDRLQLLDHRVVTKATNAATWQAEQLFDAILLDAPCTATGVLRRHPDIRLLRQAGDVEQTARLQAKLLNNLWKQLKVGGELVYVTCSLLKAENEQQIAAFLARTPSAVEVPIEADWGQARPHGRQLFPVAEGGDGFYFAKLRKTA